MRTDWYCIEFTRTVGWQPRDRQDDGLADYRGLVDWCGRCGLIEPKERKTLIERADKKPRDASRALDKARTVRTLIYQILSDIGKSGGGSDAAALETLNHFLLQAVPNRRLSLVDSAFEWTWQLDKGSLDYLLQPIIWSTAELLTAPECKRLTLCNADDCGWLFVDASKNHSRRWCDMSDCGNRAKVRRFRARKNQAKS